MIKLKVRRKEIIKIKAEIYKIETEKVQRKPFKPKAGSLRRSRKWINLNQNDQDKKRVKKHIIISKKQSDDITTNSVGITG